MLGTLFVITIFFSYGYVFGAPTNKPSPVVVDSSHHETVVDAPAIASLEDTRQQNVQPKQDDAIVKTSNQNNGKSRASLSAEELYEAAQKQTDIQREIQLAIKHSWAGYRTYAWGYDHLKPISKGGHNWFHIGLTVLDSLDTLLIAGLKQGLCFLFCFDFLSYNNNITF